MIQMSDGNGENAIFIVGKKRLYVYRKKLESHKKYKSKQDSVLKSAKGMQLNAIFLIPCGDQKE